MKPLGLTVVFLALLSSTLPVIGQQPQEPKRGLAVVPAPVGPDGAMQDLYSGSYALLIGVSRYDVPSAWAPLPSIPQELNALAAALQQAGFQRVEQIKDPTSFELQQGVQEFMRRYGYLPDARIVFFFSGHGYTLESGDRGYFVPRDAPDPLADERGFRGTAISMQQISTWAGELVARHVLFAFDSCFSGTIFSSRNRTIPASISAATQRPVRQFMTAGSAGETVPSRSIFTPVFVRGLSGAGDRNKDGYVTGSELFNYVAQEVLSYGQGQRPQFGTIRDPRLNEGDLVFAVPGGPVAAAAGAPRPRESAPNEKAVAPPPPASAPSPASSTEISVDVARKMLAGRGISWSAGSLSSALASADLEVLDLFTKGRAESGLLLEALGGTASDGRTVAQVFFERAKSNPRAAEWLRSALSQGLDPNATIKGAYYKREALVHAAVRAGNAGAVAVLLEAGASPHGYQELFLTRYPSTRFHSPFGAIVDHDTLSEDEKKSLVELFLKHGGVLPPVPDQADRPTSQASEMKGLHSKLQAMLGRDPSLTTDLRKQAQAVCKAALARDKSTDWCALVSRIPLRTWAQGYRVDWRKNPAPAGSATAPKSYHDFHYLELVALLTIVDGKAYFLGVERDTYRSTFDIVELSADGRLWRVYRYMGEQVAMGVCQKEPDGSVPRECWRRISMTYLPDKKQMMVENYYPYEISMDPGQVGSGK
jgi:hypothetical protein